jgi:iron complex outermembrane recepter protein
MYRTLLLRGVSAGALTLISTYHTLAQEALPTIDVGAPQSRRQTDGQPGQAELAPASTTLALDQPASSQNGAGLGGRFTGYSVNLETPALAGKGNIPILQAPYSVQTVTRETLDDKQAISLPDAVVGNVSGVQSLDGFYDEFIIRGFDAGAQTYRNNLKSSSYFARLQTANLQSIEVLKGPASMLFGRLEPGGIINLVPKRPLETPYYSVQEQFGSWSLTRTTVDATGPLTPDKTWLYRVNASFNHTDSHRDFVNAQDVLIAPTLTWRPNPQFQFNLDGEYQNSMFTFEGDLIPAIGKRPASVPVSRFLGDPAVTPINPSREERFYIGYDWTYEFAPSWTLTNRFAYNTVNFKDRFVYYDSLDEATGDMTRRVFDGIFPSRRTIATNLDLKGKFETGPLTHDVLLGGDFFRYGEELSGYDDSYRSTNLYFPTYANIGYVKGLPNFFYGGRQESKGIYGQDYISFAEDRLHLLLGGRYDWAWVGSAPYSAKSLADSFSRFKSATDEAFSPRLGVVIQPVPWLSFYGSYSKSFGQSNALPGPGQSAFAPQSAVQFEGGVKAELFDKRLSATLAYYDITKSNVVERITGTLFSRPVGLVESKGVELDINGRIDDHWSVIGTYAYDDARIKKDVSGPSAIGGQEGNRLMSVPFHQGSLWLKYDADGNFKGLSLAGGVFTTGERQGDNDSSFQLPGYARVDGMIQYRLPSYVFPWAKAVTAQLNVKNLLDKTYYTSSFGRFDVFPGAPRTFTASFRVEF